MNHYSLLYLCRLWYEISLHSETNKMTIDNICRCVCPALISAKRYVCVCGAM